MAKLEGKDQKIPDILVSKRTLRLDYYKGEEIYYQFYKQPNLNIIPCIELLCYFVDKFDWFSPEDYPFDLMISMNEKLFDIAFIKKEDKLIKAQIIDRYINPVVSVEDEMSLPTNVIIILDDESLYPLNIRSNNVLYCTCKPKLKFLNAE